MSTYPLQIAAISGGEVNLTEDQIARLKDNLIRLEKIEIMAQSRLAWVNSLGKEMADGLINSMLRVKIKF